MNINPQEKREERPTPARFIDRPTLRLDALGHRVAAQRVASGRQGIVDERPNFNLFGGEAQ